MPTKIGIRLVSNEDLYKTNIDTQLKRSTVTALTLKDFVKDKDFGSLLTDTSIPGSKIGTDLNGSKITNETVTGDAENTGTSPVKGKIALSTITGANIAGNSISLNKLSTFTGPSVIGRSANSAGDLAAISASADGQVLIRENNALTFKAFSTVPTGAVMSFGLKTAPSGWLACNGDPLPSSNTDYAALRALLIADNYPFGCEGQSPCLPGSNPKVPDLRGYFVRGWDNGRGVDLNRSLGSSQGDTVGTHTHTATPTITVAPTSGNAYKNLFISTSRNVITDTITGLPIGTNFVDNNTSYVGRATISATVSVANNAESQETKPKNIALLYCIKL